MPEITTSTGIVCPSCKKEVTITTKGILGGILKQAFIQSALEQITKKGATVKCSCGHQFSV